MINQQTCDELSRATSLRRMISVGLEALLPDAEDVSVGLVPCPPLAATTEALAAAASGVSATLRLQLMLLSA